jgi:glycerol-1-phosphate dehydrogenase [NAD(P)+]
VGSGVVTDVAKHACFLYEQETGHHLLYLVNQTANSVSAYTSNMAPVLIDGVKRTLPSRYPEAVISDLETLRDAPREMTMAGVGDLLSAFVSFADWYLAKRLGMDPSFNELPQALMRGLDEILLASADDIRDLRLEGMAVLAKLIHLAGLAMSLSHATTPLSGYEHVMSHTIDMNNETQGLPLAPHGSQVALASILCSGAYQAFLEQFSPEKIALDSCYPPARQMRERILSTFAQLDPSGKAGDECWADYSLKLERWTDQRENLARFLQEWHPIQQELHQLARPPQVLFQILRAVGAPLRFEELFPPVSPDSARFAFLNSPLMRRRLTLGDLLIFFQWDREKLWNQLFDDFFNFVHL